MAYNRPDQSCNLPASFFWSINPLSILTPSGKPPESKSVGVAEPPDGLLQTSFGIAKFEGIRRLSFNHRCPCLAARSVPPLRDRWPVRPRCR